MQILLDLTSDDEGRVTGQVATAGEPPVPFSGWLELLRVLEACAIDQEDPSAPTDGAGHQEETTTT